MKCMSSIISKNDVFVVQLDIHICDSKWMLSGWVVFLLSNKEFFFPFCSIEIGPHLSLFNPIWTEQCQTILTFFIQFELCNSFQTYSGVFFCSLCFPPAPLVCICVELTCICYGSFCVWVHRIELCRNIRDLQETYFCITGNKQKFMVQLS